MGNQGQYDVCFLLEGTYPFISGGVSSWVHNLISALPELQFTGICILPSSKGQWEQKYEIPENFKDLKVIYLHDYDLDEKGKSTKKKRMKQMGLLRSFHSDIFGKDFSQLDKILPIFRSPSEKGITPYDMVYGKDAWELLRNFYDEKRDSESFIDYFWTYRFTHLPLFKILCTEIPFAKVYHTISTGYAGLLGAIARYANKRPLLLTEHGIYTKERKIEIAQAEWIYVAGAERFKIEKELGVFQKLWINLFESLGRLTYHESDRIYTLYEGNRQQEIADGADPDKVSVIPNGINIERFSKLKPEDILSNRDKNAPLNVGFVGRVVPIKDVKTFVRACKIVSLHLPSVKFYIMGPTDEDPDYYKECREMVQLLRLSDNIEFTGKINVMEYYPILDLLVLTSVSEAQPLVILEASCAGIPSVASDVGSCSELLEGRTKKDKALGPSGIITQVADPSGTARGIITILSDDELRQSMSTAGRKRVELFYKESDLNETYLSIYKEFMDKR